MAAHWTPEQDAVLIHMWAEGKPVRDICRALHFSMDRVTGRRKHLSLTPRPPSDPWPAAKVARLKVLHASGVAYSTIAKELGTTRNAISGAAARHGLQRPKTVAWNNNRVASANRAPRPAPPPKPAPAVRLKAAKAKPRSEVVAIAPRHWITRKFGECAWPVDGEGADTRSCCNPTLANYCPGHLWIATQRAA